MKIVKKAIERANSQAKEIPEHQHLFIPPIDRGYKVTFSLCGSISSIATGTLNYILTSQLGLPGWIANLIVGVFIVKGAIIVYADNGSGVYIDTFWGLNGVINFLLSKVYAAW